MKKIQTILRALHVITILYIPIALLAVFVFWNDQHTHEYMQPIWFIFFFASGPVFAIYGTILFRRFAPNGMKGVIQIILALAAVVLLHIFVDQSQNESSLLENLVDSAITLYIGLYVIMISGVCLLAFTVTQVDTKNISRRLFSLLCIIAPIVATMIFAGLNYSQSLWLLTANIAIIAFTYYPHFITLFKEGSL